MSTGRRNFTAGQKAQVVRRHLAGKEPVSDLADEFGLQPSLIHNWIDQVPAQARSGPSTGRRASGSWRRPRRGRSLSWKAAKSVENKATGRPWIRVSLRGERSVGQTTSLRFQCHLTGSKSLDVILANSRTGKRVEKTLTDLATDAWTEQHLEFDTADLKAADELQFLLPAGATLLVDNVFVYEP